MKGDSTGVVKVHYKSSGKSCRGKTNIRTIFFGDTVSLGTFKQIYDVFEKKKKKKDTEISCRKALVCIYTICTFTCTII